MMFGLVEFEEQFHVGKSVVDVINQALFHIVHAFSKVRIRVIDSLGKISNAAIRVQHCHARNDHGDGDCQNLRFVQLISPAGLMAGLSLYFSTS